MATITPNSVATKPMYMWPGGDMKVGYLLLAVALAGCATPYQEMGALGGVSAAQTGNDTFRISARTNGYTDPAAAQDFVLMKAAETAQQHGATHFAIIDETDVSRTSYAVAGNVAIRARFPSQDTNIRIFSLKPGQKPPPNAYVAEDTIRFVGPRLKNPQRFGMPPG